jgi:hypothetical protein
VSEGRPRRMTLTKDRAETLRWFKESLRDAEGAQKQKVKEGDYGEAQLIQGHIEAYAYAIRYLEGRGGGR